MRSPAASARFHTAAPGAAAGRVGRAAFLLLAALASMAGLSTAHAETRAWLDRNAIAPGEAVTLNIETDQPGSAPDYTPLRDAFTLGPPYRSPATGNRTLFGIALTPRHEGAVDIPALQVGAERTAPQKLSVSAAHASAPVPRGDVFLESRVDDPAPYVQQSLGLTVRLYYATPLLSGELAQDAPDGASLQRIGDDVQSSREIGGRRYHVVERRYLLVPERSGPLALPPARFRGQGAGGFFDDFFGTDRSLSAQGAAQTLQVRPQPDGAPQPWLPLRGLELEYGARPERARAGEAVEIVVEAVAQGATAAQFPEIPAPQVEGAQVFADRAETTERFVDGGPQLTVVRRFSVVPLRPGPLRVPGTRLAWWDVAAGSAQVASLPDLSLEVAPGVAGASQAAPAPTPASPTASPATMALPADGTLPRSPWFRVAVAFALLWLATLAWLLWRKRDSGRPVVAAGERDRPAVPSMADLRRLLDAGSFDEVVGLLQRMAVPAAADLDGVIARLDDPSQRDALDAMRRALWAGQGEPSAARAALRAAFRDGPRWRAPAVVDPAPLPPLYPP